MARRRRPPRSGAIAELPPLRILGQILLLQGIYYAVALILMLFTALVSGAGFGMDLVFGWGAVRGDTTTGWLWSFVWVCCGAGMVIPIVYFISRSKLVPDFAITLHFIHLCVTTFFTGLVPRNAMWWAAMATSSAVTASLGIWGCRWRELRPISFGGHGGGSSSRATNTLNGSAGEGSGSGGGNGAGEIEGDEEMGFSRGRGRGRGRDGGGEYEMVGLKRSQSRKEGRTD